MSATAVRPATAADHERWRELYAGYAESYRVEQTDEVAERVGGWILDPGHEVRALVAVDPDGRVAGLARYRAFTRLERDPVDDGRGQRPRPGGVRQGRHPYDLGHLRHGLTQASRRSSHCWRSRFGARASHASSRISVSSGTRMLSNCASTAG